MRATTCEEIEDLIERETLGWSEADRLRVEQHLGECEACTETLAVSRFVRDTLRDAASELSDTARTRAINGALLRGKPGQTLRPGSRRVLGAAAAVLSVAAAAAVVVVATQSGTELAKPTRPAQPQVTETQVASAPPAPRPNAATTLQSANQEAAPSAQEAWIETTQPEQHRFAHADVELAAHTRARFQAARHTLELAEGKVDVDVDAARNQPFSVLTQNFRVEVLGTRFVVTPNSVSVRRGRVQVFGRDGSVLARELAAGSSYQYGPAAQNTVSPSASAIGLPRSSEGKNQQPSLAAPTSEPSVVTTKPTPSTAKSAAVWLREAREALARGDGQTTRTLLRSAEASAPSRAERADAGTLRAEAGLL
jgi:ferric-dicitrate binding protein FerR (iron transport regulator)